MKRCWYLLSFSLLLVGSIFYAGCASRVSNIHSSGSLSSPLVEGAAPVPGTSDQSGVPGPIGAFKFTEILERIGTLPMEVDQSIIPVDINSTIRINIDREHLAGASGPPVVRPFQEDLSLQRDTLLTSLRLIKEYISLSREIQTLYTATHDAEGKRLPGADVGPLRTKQKQQAETGLSILRTVKGYIAVSRKIEVSGDILYDIAVSKWMQQHQVGPTIKDPSFARFIQDEVNKMDELTRQRKDNILKAAQPVKLRLWARLIPEGGTPVPFHIPGYDNLEAGEPRIVDRLSFQLDEKGKADLKKEVEFHAKLADMVNELRDESSRLRGTLSDTYNSLVSYSRKLLDNLKPDQLEITLMQSTRKLKDQLAGLEGQLRNRRATEAELAKINDLRVKIETLHDKGNKLVEYLKELKKIQDVRNTSPSLILVDLTQKTIAEGMEGVQVLLSLLDPEQDGSIQTIIQEISVLYSGIENDPALKEKIGQDFLSHLQSTINDVFPATKEILDRNKDQIGRIAELAKILTTQSPSLVGLTEGVAVDNRTLDIPMEQIQDTEIQINRTPRRDKDLIEFTAQLIKDDGTISSEGSRLFRVTKFGLHSNVSGNVIFVDRVSTPPAEREVNFIAAPAVSYTFRYQTREESKGARVWNILNPGIGLNTALLNFQGSDIEVGIGATLSLFGDVIQAGYGYNLQVDNDHEYIFVGIGLFEMIGAVRNTQIRL